jgi:hypothetical protein
MVYLLCVLSELLYDYCEFGTQYCIIIVRVVAVLGITLLGEVGSQKC